VRRLLAAAPAGKCRPGLKCWHRPPRACYDGPPLVARPGRQARLAPCVGGAPRPKGQGLCAGAAAGKNLAGPAPGPGPITLETIPCVLPVQSHAL
jgi:hypothetical protein